MSNKRTEINKNFYEEMQLEISKQENDKIIRNSILNVGLDETATNHQAKIDMQHSFSLELKTGKITSQNKSGRCWLFAGLNTMRFKIMEDLNLKNFELSQTYQMFFDKIEKANYFLENILETLDEETDSRIIMWLLSGPLNDGGQWDMFTSIVEKYGVVPKETMPETFASSNSARMNNILTLKLRESASKLRENYKNGRTIEQLKDDKKGMLTEFYRLLTMFLGVPPKEFTFEYKDKDKKFHRDLNITPTEFYSKFVDIDLNNFVSIINAPTKDKPFNKTFTVQFLGNVEDGNDVKYLNVDMKTFKKLALSQLNDGTPVWFGSDVGKKMQRENGILDENIYNYENALNSKFDLDKAGRLDYGESLMTHAMVFTGVNLIDNIPNRWKVENSWGDKNGKKGYFVMSDKWFEEYTYQIVINKKHLSDELKKAWETEPIILKPWDPMGSLAI
ncbi:MAG: C1 family peptidase [Candidatus Marinimicrobia bacterium]|nr:C1 family peptidase [Candidatus Neomarinimicrobiota bacterium]